VLLEPDNRSDVDFSRPTDEPALISPHSVSWRVCKNPISLFIGGVAAVIMELAEPRVRTGVWEHTTFRKNPILRLRRTGIAAMVTICGPHSKAEAMIARVRRMHGLIEGVTPPGEPYRACGASDLGSGHGGIRLSSSLSCLRAGTLFTGARPLLCRGCSGRSSLRRDRRTDVGSRA